jgi:hypothetical protein
MDIPGWMNIYSTPIHFRSLEHVECGRIVYTRSAYCRGKIGCFAQE